MIMGPMMSEAENFKVERVTGWGVKVNAMIDVESLPPILLEYERLDKGNTRLKMTTLPDQVMAAGRECRKLELCLFSDESIATFFNLLREVEEEVTTGPAGSSSLLS